MVAQLLDSLYIGCCRCDEMAHATNVFAGAGVRLAAGRAAFTPCDEALVPRVGERVSQHALAGLHHSAYHHAGVGGTDPGAAQFVLVARLLPLARGELAGFRGHPIAPPAVVMLFGADAVRGHLRVVRFHAHLVRFGTVKVQLTERQTERQRDREIE